MSYGFSFAKMKAENLSEFTPIRDEYFCGEQVWTRNRDGAKGFFGRGVSDFILLTSARAELKLKGSAKP